MTDMFTRRKNKPVIDEAERLHAVEMERRAAVPPAQFLEPVKERVAKAEEQALKTYKKKLQELAAAAQPAQIQSKSGDMLTAEGVQLVLCVLHS